jgi:tight adherence protein C
VSGGQLAPDDEPARIEGGGGRVTLLDSGVVFSLGIAFLAAVAGGLLGLALAESLAAASARSRLPVGWTARLLPWLRAAGTPQALRRRWGTAAAARLVMAGIAWEPEDFAGLRWLALWAGAGLSLLLLVGRRGDLVAWFLATVTMVAAAAGPNLWVALRIERRQRDVARRLPDFLDRVSLALEAGLGFEVALRRSAERFPGRLGGELRRMVRQIDRGHTRTAAMDEMAERNPSEDLVAFAAAVRQSDRLGTSLARTLRIQGDLLRARRKRRAQEAGRRLPVLIVFPLVFFFLPALLIVYLAPPLLHLFLGR